jgi:hypothetical protein
MKRFTDRHGHDWDVVLGRESWGAQLALFVPLGVPDRPVRQAMLGTSAADSAMLELERLDDTALQQLLDRSTIKDQ